MTEYEQYDITSAYPSPWPKPEALWKRALRARASETAARFDNTDGRRLQVQRLMARAGEKITTWQLRCLSPAQFRATYEWAHNRVARIDTTTPYPPWIET
jgi:hypothetical protein